MRFFFQLLIGVILVFGSLELQAQTILFNNGKMTVKDSQQVYINGHLVNNSSELKNEGEVSLTGNMINNATIFDQGNGIFRFIGNVEQTIILNAACNAFDVEVNNPDGLVFMGNDHLNINNSLFFEDGILNTNSAAMIVFEDGANYFYANDFSFIDGPAQKVGEQDFEFPVGKNNTLRPILISNLTDFAVFQAEYFDYSYNNIATDSSLQAISLTEYWDLVRTEGVGNANVTLTYNTNSGIIFEDTEIARFNDSLWTKVEATIDNSSSPAYKLASDDVVELFTAFTFSKTQFYDPDETFVFTAYQDMDCEIEVDWVISTATGNIGYEIEYSFDSIEFETLVFVPGDPASKEQYQAFRYMDLTNYTANVIYFRLRLLNPDGSYSFSDIIPVKNNCNQIECVLYPNPVSSTENINLAIWSPEKFEMPVRVVDVLGRVLMEEVLYIEEGQGSYEVNTTNPQLSTGTYFLQVSREKSLKFIVAHGR